MTRTVPAAGPLDAPLLLVGEAPGPHEVARGEPFANPAGAGGYVRATLGQYGIPWDRVRRTNVIPHNPGRLTLHSRKRLVAEHWTNIDADLARSPRVIVACGSAALLRLTGLTDITDETGGVWPTHELPHDINLAGTWRPSGLPLDSLVVACLHPAGVMQTKIQAERVLIDAALRRACEYAQGRKWVPRLPTVVEQFSVARLNSVLAASRCIVIDTEFDVETGIPFLVGVLGDAAAEEVFIWAPQAAVNAVLQTHLRRPGVIAIAHYSPADRASLAKIGVERDDWFDTMYAYATLYPDLNVGLNHAALHFCDDAANWKAMSTTDPLYLALDVHRTWRVYEAVREHLHAAGLTPLWIDEVTPSVGLMDGLERAGLRVDAARQVVLLADNATAQEALAARITARVGDRFVGTQVTRKCDEIAALLPAGWPGDAACPVHPAYRGIRAKRWAADETCCCRALHEALPVERVEARPFAPGNNHDLRRLLYETLGLPVQRHPNTGSPTADADAVNRLCVRLTDAQGSPRSKYHRADWAEIVALLTDVKEFQHLDKMRSTFLTLPVDAEGYAHPQHRGWGTGTGRPAGGFDADLALEGASSTYTFNAFNLPRAPERCRELFIPRDGWRFVYADWSALESWLTAYFADDPVLFGELRAALAGAPKPHALNAALLYGCDPADAKSHAIILKGRPSHAYDGGKRISHLWNYGGEAGKIAQTFWLDRAFAIEVERKLSAKYRAIAAWRTRLADQVYGVLAWTCARCGAPRTGEQPRGAVCACGGMLRRDGWAEWPKRELRTPFGRRRLYLGRRSDGRKAVASQLPQSSGASMWYRTLHRLHGFEVVDGERRAWPTPTFAYRVVTGTYDSFLLECPAANADMLLQWLTWTMEQPWSLLGGLRIPVEGFVGANYGEASAANTEGLTAVDAKAFTAVWRAQ